MPLNCLIFQDEIAKMIANTQKCKYSGGKGDIGEMLTSKQLKANAGKSKFAILGAPKSRTEILTNRSRYPGRTQTWGISAGGGTNTILSLDDTNKQMNT